MRYKQFVLQDGSTLLLYEDVTIEYIPMREDGELDFDNSYMAYYLGEGHADES